MNLMDFQYTIDIDRFLMYADIPSHILPGGGGGGYCSPHILVTAEKPDLVIIDRMEEKMDIFELTVKNTFIMFFRPFNK